MPRFLLLRVCNATPARALRIGDAILKEGVYRGGKVSVKGDRTTVVIFESAEVPLPIKEHSTAVIQDDPEERKKKSWYRWDRKFMPTGPGYAVAFFAVLSAQRIHLGWQQTSRRGPC